MSDIPLVEIPAELLAEMRERVWFHTASLFVVERSTPVYKGTRTFVAVAPEEQSTFGEKGAILKISLFASVVASAQVRDGFDYMDLSYFHEERPDLPRSYGGNQRVGLVAAANLESGGRCDRMEGRITAQNASDASVFPQHVLTPPRDPHLPAFAPLDTLTLRSRAVS